MPNVDEKQFFNMLKKRSEERGCGRVSRSKDDLFQELIDQCTQFQDYCKTFVATHQQNF